MQSCSLRIFLMSALKDLSLFEVLELAYNSDLFGTIVEEEIIA